MIFFKLTAQTFSRAEIRSIFNLQSRNEHKDCGIGIHKESGFSYDPIDFTSTGSKRQINNSLRKSSLNEHFSSLLLQLRIGGL